MKQYITGRLVFIEDSGYFGILTERHTVKELHENDCFDIMLNDAWISAVMFFSPEGWVFLCHDENIMDNMPPTGIEVRYLPEGEDEELPF